MVPLLPLLLLLPLSFAGCASTPPVATTAPSSGPFKLVYLVSHGWHVGIAMARADVASARWPESADLGDVRYLEVGWGDGTFYPAPRGTVGLALKAALRSESSVLHVTGFDAPVAEFFAGSTVIPLPVSLHGFDALSRFIHHAYARDPDGRTTVIGPGLYGDSRFYRAAGRYRLLDNSNTWTARALHAAGCPIDPASVITAGTVLEAARTFGRC